MEASEAVTALPALMVVAVLELVMVVANVILVLGYRQW